MTLFIWSQTELHAAEGKKSPIKDWLVAYSSSIFSFGGPAPQHPQLGLLEPIQTGDVLQGAYFD